MYPRLNWTAIQIGLRGSESAWPRPIKTPATVYTTASTATAAAAAAAATYLKSNCHDDGNLSNFRIEIGAEAKTKVKALANPRRPGRNCQSGLT